MLPLLALFPKIFVSASLTSVSLLANRFDDETVAMLLKLKEEKPTLTTLCGLKPNQTEADFEYWGLTPQDAKLLAPEIAVHSGLTKLDLSYNNLSAKAKKIIRKAVKRRKGFVLELRGN